MTFRRLLAGSIAGAALLTVAVSAAPAAAAGSLVIVGGALRYENDAVWQRMVDLGGGQGAKVAVIAAASGNPQKYGTLAVEEFASHGAEAFLVPLSPREGKFDRAYTEVRQDPEWVARVKDADVVWFTGGAQERIVKALLEDGKDSPLMAAIRDVYARGGVIGGSSAGAAVMSDPMFRDAQDVFHVMANGLTMGEEIDRGLGFMPQGWFVDQHFLTRGRFARSLVAMRDLGLPYGIGVDEDTAAVVTDGTALEVIGYKGVVFMDMSDATWSKDGPFNVKNVKLSYLDRGDRMDLTTRQVTPSEAKASDLKVDPNAADFDPYYGDYQFVPDMLGNTALLDVMANLVDNKHAEAHGLAFRRTAPDAPFEGGYAFRFYRGADTLGWYTGKFGGEDYTVTNIHLDVTPVTIAPDLATPTN